MNRSRSPPDLSLKRDYESEGEGLETEGSKRVLTQSRLGIGQRRRYYRCH